MAQTVQIWNGETPINGIPAEEVLANRADLRNALGDIFLVMQGEQVCEIQIGRIIAANYEMEPGMNLQQIADEYMVRKQREKEEAEMERMTNEELQEEVANLSYEVMMLQEDAAVAMAAEGEHSPKFQLIRRWFNRGFWNAEMVQDAVTKGWLREDERMEIVGE